ncbi:DUF2397 domain-containing protein, partial [Kitasatospora sp. DSM 101779]|uniref:DUF2397 domain-containing protein n=1 Tax=Kitasatospora sp. DSM 101779 TaxID=2853165 RepID=UPI0021DACF39
MEQHEYATGARGAAGGVADGRMGGAGQLTAQARTGAYPQAELLARRFADADEADAHRLFTAVFGLYPARHLGGRPADPHGQAAGTSWWHGPTVHRAPAASRPRGLR